MSSAVLLIFGLAFAGCNNAKPASDTLVAPGQSASNPPAASEQSANSAGNGFEMNLFSDQEVYKSTDKIQIWATLEYMGDGDTVKIWHGNPYVVFSITDGKDFSSGYIVQDILASTILDRGELYSFDYQKSGGWGADDPSAAFWENFYSEKDLMLPAGEYTVTASGAFSLNGNMAGSRSALSCKLEIKVE
jgi:hypothetical protein